MSKEIVFGAIPALIIFLAFLGVNIAPLVIGGLLVAIVAYFLIRGSGGMAIGQGKKAKNTVPKTDMRFEDIGGQERAKGELKEALDFLDMLIEPIEQQASIASLGLEYRVLIYSLI